MSTYRDAFGIAHAPDCRHPQRTFRAGNGWACASCGAQSLNATTEKETKK